MNAEAVQTRRQEEESVSRELSRALEQSRSRLFALCYRMTGVAADAEDLVQETFAQALAQPPADLSRDLQPWLVRVATNRCRDHLRRRRARGYVGPWLPSPVESDSLEDGAASASARYSERESLSFGFLLALEALTPTQRAVLVLRDALDYSVRETAEALDLSEANVKTTLHRARSALSEYDRSRLTWDETRTREVQGALTRFILHVSLGDATGLARLFSEHVTALNDGGGEFFAAQRPVVGAERVARFFTKIGRHGRIARARPGLFNGLPGLFIEVDAEKPGAARRQFHAVELAADGRIDRIYTVLASHKLAHLP
jgi:RNA polymerase sigma-70 factor (ECF subfamily)